MLRELRIKNLAIVEDADVEFREGLNVLTGSTGAGKSIILSAVELLSGKRVNRGLLRRGSDSLTIEGIFEVPETWPLREEMGFGKDEDMLSIKRELKDNGKSRVWVNGLISTASMAKRITESLLEIHGQHRQQELLDPSNHILYLDSVAPYSDLIDECVRTIKEYREARENLRRMIEEREKNKRQEDFLKFELNELESLHLTGGLEVELEKKIKRLENIHRYRSLLNDSVQILSEGDSSVSDELTRLVKKFEELGEIDEKWLERAKGLEETIVNLEEIAREIERDMAREEDEVEDIEILQEKLASIQKAKRKYNLDCDGLIEKREEIRSIISSLEDGEAEIEKAEREIDRLIQGLVPLLERLSEERKKLATSIDKRITREIQELGMKGALFKIKVESGTRELVKDREMFDRVLSPRGWDRVEFLIRTNIGEDVHPLSGIVSGGELSRITLVLRKIFVEAQNIPTLIFDEIDSGIGADLADAIADKLSELAENYQVVCITHLPHIASRAKHHIMVKKSIKDNRTVASATVLGMEERINEISRMLGGNSKLREQLAREMLSGNGSARSSAG